MFMSKKMKYAFTRIRLSQESDITGIRLSQELDL